jgi:hypothetical protein
MRCAILISGYTRTFEKTSENLLNFINSNENIIFDLFLSVNTEEVEAGKHKGHLNTLEHNKALLKELNPKILHQNDLKSREENNHEHSQYGNLNNLYNLFIDYSSNHGIDYDLIIRSRFDNLILDYPNLESLVKYDQTITVPRGFFYGMSGNFKEKWDKNFLWKNPKEFRKIDEEIKYNFIINDRFAIGTPSSMSHYFTFGLLENKIHDFTEKKFNIKSTEGAMAFALKRSGVRIRWDEDLVTKIVRE